MKKSFYHLYLQTQEGSGFIELDFNTTSIPNLKRFVEYHLYSAPYYCFYYGIFAWLGVIENGEIVAEFNLLDEAKIQVKGIGSDLLYREDTDEEWPYDENETDLQFHPWEGVFFNHINEEEKEILKNLVKNHPLNEESEEYKIQIDWEKVIPLTGDLLTQENEPNHELSEVILSGLPVWLGSVITVEKEEQIMSRIGNTK